ncbi:MAG: glutamine synthetase family protein [Thaumarchaeota archaeon]|nr:glutamine synthetase family protein [Nitrososphaerota archaeon]
MKEDQAEGGEKLLSEIKRKIKEKEVKNVRLEFCNASGVPCAKAWNATHLDDLLKEGINIFRGNYFMCLGRSLSPHSKFTVDSGDVTLVPDLETFGVLPYVGGTGRFYGDLFDANTGEPWECCARSLLKRKLTDLAEKGFLFESAGELEFYLTRKDPSFKGLGKLYSSSEVPPFSSLGLDLGSAFINNALNNLLSSGLDVSRIVKEGGPGQFELNLVHSEGIKPADEIITLRETIKGTAVGENLHATFMPKPFVDELGNGMHIHMSLKDSKTKKNLFEAAEGLSTLGLQFAAGILNHGAALCAVAAPTVNSYKRLRSGWIAVDEMRLGAEDRGAALRIPKASSSSSGGARLEYRVPDACSNPYLLMSCLISAGLDGLEKGLDQSSLKTNLPRSLGEALREFKQNALFRELMGKTFFEEYTKLKEFELDLYNTQVSEFEIEKYGSAY